MRVIFIFFIGLQLACNLHSDERIIVPKLKAGFYTDALDRVDEALSSEPENRKLIEQKRFICEQLGWPVTCLSALESTRQSYGMTSQLVDQYIAYYQIHKHYDRLYDLFDRWDNTYSLKSKYVEVYIESLVHLNQTRLAYTWLSSYARSNNSVASLAFLSNQYLNMGDELMAAYYLGKLSKLDNTHDLMWQYGKILFSLEHYDLAFEAVERYVDRTDSLDVQLQYATMLAHVDKRYAAINRLRSYQDIDTVAYMLASFYSEENRLDSAAIVLNTLSEKRKTDRKPIWRLAKIYEDKGWFSYALRYYEKLLVFNPNDSLAIERIGLIQRKIAYLQRQKFEEQKAPVFELKPIKVNN